MLKLQLQVSASVCKLIRHPKISWLNKIVPEALDLWSLSCRGKTCSGQGIALEICKAYKRTNSFFLLNCAAAVKILKKHDKCTGSDLRWNYIHHVEAQDFYVLQPQFQEYTKQCKRLMGVGELEQPSMSDEELDLEHGDLTLISRLLEELSVTTEHASSTHNAQSFRPPASAQLMCLQAAVVN